LRRFREFQKPGYSFFVNIFCLQGANSNPANAQTASPFPC
jgi:hypothetical protein